jgi:WXXGXW repeat (2 copies)
MRVSKSTRTIAALALVATMGGCMASAGGGQGGAMITVGFISREPPPLRVEVMSERPSAEHVWIRGHWSGNGNDYAWTAGHWERREQGRREWVEGKWEHEKRGWHWVEGHWN